MNQFIDREAESDSNEESMDEDTGEIRKKPSNGKPKKKVHDDAIDSSEEEDTSDEEKGLAQIRQGFIVDDEEDEDEGEEEEERPSGERRHRKKRRRPRREEEEEDIDDSDRELIAENTGQDFARDKHKFKRLKRGGVDARTREDGDDLAQMFSDEEMDDVLDDEETAAPRRRRREEPEEIVGEFDNFIEEDEFSDEETEPREKDERAERSQRQTYQGIPGISGDVADPEALEQMLEVFGDGTDYDWAMQTAENEEQEQNDVMLELKDVFEPSELQERMLTDADNDIRLIDIPERFQIARQPYAHIVISDEEFAEEAKWVADKLLTIKQPALKEGFRDSFFRAVKKVLEFLVIENLEVPFIYQNRKDYLIHAERFRHVGPNGEVTYTMGTAERLLSQDELWIVFDYDLQFRAFVDKRNAIRRTFEQLGKTDEVFEECINDLANVQEVQDLQDYVHFQYAEELKDIAIINSNNGTNGSTKKKPGSTRSQFEVIRKSRVYSMVKEFGISSSQFADNAKLDQKRHFADDPAEFPNELADQFLDGKLFSTSADALAGAKKMLAEEIYMSPILRKVMRKKIFHLGTLRVDVTDKGVKKIDELHPYYDFKYLKNQSAQALLEYPARFLQMLKAEEEHLIDIRIDIENKERMMTQLFELMRSENYSDQAEAWNEERKEVLATAVFKILKLMAKDFREVVKTWCEDALAKSFRKAFSERLDQAPYIAKGLKNGEIPRVFAISHGNGDFGKDPTVGVFMDEDGRAMEDVKYQDFKDPNERARFIEVLNRRKPDVLAVGGFGVSTSRLVDDLRALVEDENLTIMGTDSDEHDDDRTPLEVVFVQDEVARLYMNHERATTENAKYSPVARYCVGLARYMQDPLLEYAALKDDIISINFHPDQQLIPQEKLKAQIEQVMVDMVNLVGVDINRATKDPYRGNMLQYICGLGPRKATQVMKIIDSNHGTVKSRALLVGDPEQDILPVVGPVVFTNCASFLIIMYDATVSNESEYLDNTRVHPEDYELGRKMASDALELDEEDVANMTEQGQDPGAVVRQLIETDEQDKVNELILEEYAEELEKNFNQRKRATLETIRAELQMPFEELRNPFRKLTTEQIFTKLTGETEQSLHTGMVVPVAIRKVTDRYIACRLDCGIEGNVQAQDMSDDIDTPSFSPHSIFHQGLTVQAKILNINSKTFYAELSLRESALRNPYRKPNDKMPDEWDERREEKDRVALQVTNQEEHRAQRVIKHPLFRSFNARQAEEFLAQLSRGDAVIRPSSKGHDHIAVTWKVDEGVYQHIDVLELDKENEFSVGRTLKVAGKYSYGDLDDLMYNHVKSMSRKVEEMEAHEKYKNMPKDQVEQWLTTYTEANPKRAIYAFCINPKQPGRFFLCFKNGMYSKCRSWDVSIVPQAYMLQGNVYPDMTALCNGFKILHTNFMQKQAQDQGGHRGDPRQQFSGRGPPPPRR